MTLADPFCKITSGVDGGSDNDCCRSAQVKPFDMKQHIGEPYLNIGEQAHTQPWKGSDGLSRCQLEGEWRLETLTAIRDKWIGDGPHQRTQTAFSVRLPGSLGIQGLRPFMVRTDVCSQLQGGEPLLPSESFQAFMSFYPLFPVFACVDPIASPMQAKSKQH